jgi:hypothetical protein
MNEGYGVKAKFKFKPKARLRVGTEPTAKGAVRWKNQKIRSGKAFRVSPLKR